MHIVQVNAQNDALDVYRFGSDGCHVLFTSYPFEKILAAGFDKFAKQIGEDLILDNRELRKLLKLD